MRISPELHAQLIEHAREEAPNECCGMIATRDGEAIRLYRATNQAASPLRFVIDELEQMRIYEQIDGDGLELGALYHSHTRTKPEPSQTDVAYGLNPLLAGISWIIVGLADEEPEVRAFLITGDGQVEETELEVG